MSEFRTIQEDSPVVQCSAPIKVGKKTREWRERRFKSERPDFDPHKCQYAAEYYLDNKPMCQRHTADALLVEREKLDGVA